MLMSHQIFDGTGGNEAKTEERTEETHSKLIGQHELVAAARGCSSVA